MIVQPYPLYAARTADEAYLVVGWLTDESRWRTVPLVVRLGRSGVPGPYYGDLRYATSLVEIEDWRENGATEIIPAVRGDR